MPRNDSVDVSLFSQATDLTRLFLFSSLSDEILMITVYLTFNQAFVHQWKKKKQTKEVRAIAPQA